jgi:hypothetical protein
VEDVEERFLAFLDQVDTRLVPALVLGMTSSHPYRGEGVVDLLTRHAAAFPALRALFVGDVVSGESDVAYLEQPDLMPIFAAFPALEEFRVRGNLELGAGLTSFRALTHGALRTLVFESGGLAPAVVRAVGECELPALEHLEFYLGDAGCGGGTSVADLEWLLSGERFPRLRRLGLRDAPNQDEIAAALAHAPVVARLETLDLSLGTLGDEGAVALLAGQPLTHLAKLDLHHHFVSKDMRRRLHEALRGVELDLSGSTEPAYWRGEEHRYIAISE